jgi:hypothetical protein
LKARLLAANGRSRWDKLDSLLTFPKMGGQWAVVDGAVAVKRCFIFTHYYSHNAYSLKIKLNLEAESALEK